MSRFLGACAFTALVFVQTMALARSVPPSEPVESIWRVQSLPFEYSSSNVYYNCGSLRQKVRAILLAVGAHESVVVQTNCQDGPTNRISGRIALATPVPATEDNLREATTFNTQDELVARLRSASLPTANDLVRFPAAWQTTSLSSIRDMTLTPADCELIKGITEQIFPRIAVRVIQSRKLMCGNYSSTFRPQMKFEALLPVTDQR